MAPTSDVGFNRVEMYTSDLVGTVKEYGIHLVAVVESAATMWPRDVDSPEFSPLVASLSVAIKEVEQGSEQKIKLTLIEGDGRQGVEGDVYVFPQMLKYSGITAGNASSFVKSSTVGDGKWEEVERLEEDHILVCAHNNVDARCGACGPVLVSGFRKAVQKRGLRSKVWPCSHIGGHKYAGNVIAYTRQADGNVGGDWYGYVTPADVPTLLNAFEKGIPVDKLWRGAIGMSKDMQKESFSSRQTACSNCSCNNKNFPFSVIPTTLEAKTRVALLALTGAVVLAGVAFYVRRQST